MRFAYPFQKVVDLKTNEKKQAESGLSQAIGVLSSTEGELAELMQVKHQTQEGIVDGVAATRLISEMLMGQQYVDYLEGRIQSTRRKLVKAEQVVEERREFLTNKSIDEKVWLKAKEKAYENFRSIVSKRAQNELDEMASNRRPQF